MSTEQAGVMPPAAFLPTPGVPAVPWSEWIANFETFLEARGGTERWPITRKVALLKHCLGAEGQAQYRAIEGQAAEGKDEYESAVQRLTRRFARTKSVAAARMEFGLRKQRTGETVAEYVAALRRLTSQCKFPVTADDAIVSQLTTHTTCGAVRESLLQAPDSEDYQSMIARAMRAESNAADTAALEKATAVNAVHVARHEGGRPGPSRTETDRCRRCNSEEHATQSPKCPARRAKCLRCGKEGHFARVCSRRDQRGVRVVDALPEYQRTPQEAWDEVHEAWEQASKNKPNIPIYLLSSQPLDSEIVENVRIEGRIVRILVDTGAAVSILNIRDFQGDRREIVQSKIVLRSYSGEIIRTLGVFNGEIELGKQVARCRLFVVENGRSLLGRDALRRLGVKIDCVGNKCVVNKVETQENCGVFSEKLGKVVGFEHVVKEKKNVRPIQQKVRRLPMAVRENVQKEIEKLQELDVIEQIEASEWISAIVVVAKKDGRVRLCVDLRAVNEAIVADVFPLPHIEDLLTNLKGATVFSKLDALSAYHQVELAEKSRDLTAFITPWGLFRFKRVPFGLASAPAAFQRMMEKILEGLAGVIVYLDDILIYGATESEHDDRLGKVLERIKQAGMTLNKKCEIRTRQVEFVGFSIDGDGIRPTRDNIEAVRRLPEPENVSQIKSVLGTASFYMRCVPDFSTIAEPMRRLLKKDTKFEWGTEQRESFERLKKAVVNAKPLAIFDHKREIVVATDASNVGLGATLLQKYDDGERPVAFASCALNTAQQRYSTGEKEALACVFAIERWHVFLYGRKFKLRTDHQALVTLLGASGTGRAPMRIARWIERLRGYNFTVEYRPGSSNNVPDMLSRMPLPGLFTTGGEEELVVANIGNRWEPIHWKEIAAQSNDDEELQLVRKWLRTKQPKVTDKRWASVINELSENDGVLLREKKIVLPAGLREAAFGIAHDEAHQGMVRTKQRLREIFWWPSMDRFVEEKIRDCRICENSDRTARSVTAPIEPTPWPSAAWERLAVDIRGPDDSVSHQDRFAVVVIDYYSKWAEVELMEEATAGKIVAMFRRIMGREGVPKQIVSDNGTQFLSREFQDLMKEFGIQHRRTPVYHPQANGLVERFNRTLGGFLQTAARLGGNTNERIQTMITTYNATPQATTGKSPAELLHGKRMRTKLDVVGKTAEEEEGDDQTRERVTRIQNKQKTYADERRAARTEEIQPGDWVRCRKPQARKGQSKYGQPVQVKEKIGANSYRTEDGRTWHRNSIVRANQSQAMPSQPVLADDSAESDNGESEDEEWRTPPETRTPREQRRRRRPRYLEDFVLG